MPRKVSGRLRASIGRLAEHIPYGELLAETDPATFIDEVIKRLVALEKIAALPIGVDSHPNNLCCATCRCEVVLTARAASPGGEHAE